VTELAGRIDEVNEILRFAEDLSDGQLDDPETRAAAEAAYEILCRLLGRAA
jgi:hypothetical protein